MSEWVWRLLSLSLAGTLLALALFVVQPVARRFLSRRVLYVLWVVVMVRMLVPVGLVGLGASVTTTALPTRPPSVTSAAPTSSASTSSVSVSVAPTRPSIPTAVPTPIPTGSAGTTSVAPTRPAATPTPAATPLLPFGGGITALLNWIPETVTTIQSVVTSAAAPFAPFLLLLWVAGFVASLLATRVRHARFRRSLRRVGRPASETDRLLLADCRRELGIGPAHSIELIRVDSAPTPFLLGVFRTTLCLPGREYTSSDLRLILLHELTHLRFLDLGVKLVSQAVCAVHWFNPAVRFMRREVSHACELACDESVSQPLSPTDRDAYAEMLVRLASAPGMRFFSGAQALSESGQKLHRRLQVIAQKEGPPRRKRFAGLIALLVLLLLPLPQFAPFALTGCAAVPSETPTAPAADWQQIIMDPTHVASFEAAFYPWTDATVLRTSDKETIDRCTKAIGSLPHAPASSLTKVPDASTASLKLVFKGDDGGVRTFYFAGETFFVEEGGSAFLVQPASVRAFRVLVGGMLEKNLDAKGVDNLIGIVTQAYGTKYKTTLIEVHTADREFLSVELGTTAYFNATGDGGMLLFVGDAVRIFYTKVDEQDQGGGLILRVPVADAVFVRPIPTPGPTTGSVSQDPVLTRAQVDAIGIGFSASQLRGIAVANAEMNTPIPTTCRILEGGTATFEFAGLETGNGFVVKIVVNDDRGTTTIVPVPDAAPLEDFVLQCGDFRLKTQGAVSLKALLGELGTPLGDDLQEKEVEGFGKIRLRDLRFEGLSVHLYQMQDSPDPDLWAVWGTLATSAAYATPRGLVVGLDRAEVVRRLGTGEFLYYVDTLPDTASMDIAKTTEEGEYTSMTLTFVDGKVASIETVFQAP